VATLVETKPVSKTARDLAGVEFAKNKRRPWERALGAPIGRFIVVLLNQ
jgi:hypothetical protein